MAEVEIFSGSYGFDITIETGRDLTNASSLRLRIRNPNGTNVDKTLDNSNVLDPKIEGKVRYTVQANDLSVPGLYKLQLFDETGSSQRLTTDILKLKVKASLDFINV